MTNLETCGLSSGPANRSIYDIILSCAQTAVLCAWVSVCVNVPCLSSARLDILRDKVYFGLLTLLGPELVFLLALGQYQCARASVRDFHLSGHKQWTATHAFYADMGGIVVQPVSWKRFPVNAKQLLYLIDKGYLEYPTITVEEIKARSKVDGLSR